MLYDWHLLDARAIWVKELAAALTKQVKLLCWIPDITWTGYWQNRIHDELIDHPPLLLRHFQLQRGFARWPVRWLCHEGKRIAQRCLRYSSSQGSVLLCASPQYASVAKEWRGPVIYYMSDLYYAWGDDPNYVNYHDKLMCQRADLVCPVSERGKAYLIEKAACPEEKIVISPMATRQSNLLPEPLLQPAPLPAAIADLPRPIIGIIGNLARNTDWLFLRQVIDALPNVSWVFVGSTEMDVPDADHRQARDELQQRAGRVRFVGSKPYGELASYARAFELALLPYRKIEPTYSGSSTRFYEHLAACRPMYTTDGFAELLTKQPLVHLVKDPNDFIGQVQDVAKNGFCDGHETARWQASKNETWEVRAAGMIEALKQRKEELA